MSGTFEQAKTFFLQGVAHYEAGRFAQAEREYEASLALLPGRASTLANLGAARVKLGKLQEALDVLGEALAQEPGDARSWGHRAVALAETGQPRQALECVERLLALDPRVGHGWSLRGRLLKELGRPQEAAAAFETALANGADPELNRYFLASLGVQPAPPAPPRDYVEALFDGYAEGFDRHLVEVLKYRAPDVLVERLAATGRRFERALDLGCGTGLCGALVRPLAQRLEGVDVSGNMVGLARARGIYDRLEQADLLEYLAAAGEPCDLVIAADVFIYVGALEAVFAAVSRLLPPGGVFCFSVEEAESQAGLELRPSMRYAHSEAYLRSLAGACGFDITATARHPIREDQQAPIPGLFAWLVRR